MTKNMHAVDRVARVIVGVVLVSMAFVGPQNKWFLLGFIPVITGLIGTCPIYSIMGINGHRKVL